MMGGRSCDVPTRQRSRRTRSLPSDEAAVDISTGPVSIAFDPPSVSDPSPQSHVTILHRSNASMPAAARRAAGSGPDLAEPVEMNRVSKQRAKPYREPYLPSGAPARGPSAAIAVSPPAARTLMRQAPMAADEYLHSAIDCVDAPFGQGLRPGASRADRRFHADGGHRFRSGGHRAGDRSDRRRNREQTRMTASSARRKRRLMGQTTLTPLSAEPPRSVSQELVLRGMIHSLGDIVRRDIAAAMINVQNGKQPRQIDRRTAEKTVADALLVFEPALRSKLVLAGLRAALARLTPDFAPQAFADAVLELLKAHDTPTSSPSAPTNREDEQ